MDINFHFYHFIRHKESKQIKAFVTAFMENRLFGEFIPQPSELRGVRKGKLISRSRRNFLIKKYGYANRDEWRRKNWGASVDVGAAGRWARLTVLGDKQIKLVLRPKIEIPKEIIKCWRNFGYSVFLAYGPQ